MLWWTSSALATRHDAGMSERDHAQQGDGYRRQEAARLIAKRWALFSRDDISIVISRVSTQVDRLKDSSLLEPKVVETEKVLNGLIRALRDNV